MKYYRIERARGLAVGCHRYLDANWTPSEAADSLEDARKEMARLIGLRLDYEDRGEEYEEEWRRLASEAMSANVGDVIAFPEAEMAWKIVEVADE